MPKVQAEIIENIRIGLNVASHVKTKDHRVAKHVTLRMVDMLGMCQQWPGFLGFIITMCLM
jgi:calcineurin-like phosphoesterase